MVSRPWCPGKIRPHQRKDFFCCSRDASFLRKSSLFWASLVPASSALNSSIWSCIFSLLLNIFCLALTSATMPFFVLSAFCWKTLLSAWLATEAERTLKSRTVTHFFTGLFLTHWPSNHIGVNRRMIRDTLRKYNSLSIKIKNARRCLWDLPLPGCFWYLW